MTRTKYSWSGHVKGLNRRSTTFKVGRVPGTQMFHAKDFEALAQERETACREIMALNAAHGGNVHQRLTRYRKYSEVLIALVLAQTELIDGLLTEQEHLLRGHATQSGRRWTDEQDEALVNLACDPDPAMIKIALALNRTPGAVASRLTYLVGVSKVSRHVVGRITGYLDGEPVSGNFDGVLLRPAS